MALAFASRWPGLGLESLILEASFAAKYYIVFFLTLTPQYYTAFLPMLLETNRPTLEDRQAIRSAPSCSLYILCGIINKTISVSRISNSLFMLKLDNVGV